jgi:adenylate cyclase
VLDPDNARAYSVLAVLQLVDGQHDTAIESARKAVASSRSDAEAHLNLGLVLAFSGRPTEARAAVESALRLNPKPHPGALLLAGIGFFADGQYERAVDAIEQARNARPTDETARVYLASAYAHLDRTDEARAEVEALIKIFPMANLGYYRVRDRYYKRGEDLATFIDGLRKAGMPEWPFSFRGNEEDRLDESGLKAVTLDHTWAGTHANGVQFVQQISRTGVIAYRSQASFLTGTSEVHGDMLCQQFEGFLLDRRLCGYVYRNPRGTRENNDEYVSVMPYALKYFSVVQ